MQSLSIYLLALEPSGDVIGARLMESLSTVAEGKISVSGVGGPLMCNAGLESLFDPKDLAILGVFEVLPKARLVLSRVREVLADVERVQPDILVTIDSWGFTGRVHKALTKQGSAVKRVRYVAPQVWAWRPGRAKQLAGWIDHLLTLFPFEPVLFERHGLPATWVGHPVADEPFAGDGARFRNAHSINEHTTVLSVLPGSRSSEVKALMPVFGAAIDQLAGRDERMFLAIPTTGNVEAEVRAWAETLPLPNAVLTNPASRDDAFAASRAAMAASGTVTLELAKAGVPHLIAYKVNPLSAMVFKRLAQTSSVNLVNILLDDQIVPECLQDRCAPGVIAKTMAALLDDSVWRTRQNDAFATVMSRLSPGDMSPSEQAARTVLSLVDG